MTTQPTCQITAQLFDELEALLRRGEAMDAQGLALLGQKLAAAQVVATSEVAAGIVTVGRTVTYRVGSATPITRTLVRSAEANTPDWALSLNGRHGLALLGLEAGQAIDLALADGGRETLTVEQVTTEAEGARVVSLRRPVAPPRLVASDKVVTLSFPSRPAPSRVFPTSEGPDDDDPGPRAA